MIPAPKPDRELLLPTLPQHHCVTLIKTTGTGDRGAQGSVCASAGIAGLAAAPDRKRREVGYVSYPKNREAMVSFHAFLRASVAIGLGFVKSLVSGL